MLNWCNLISVILFQLRDVLVNHVQVMLGERPKLRAGVLPLKFVCQQHSGKWWRKMMEWLREEESGSGRGFFMSPQTVGQVRQVRCKDSGVIDSAAEVIVCGHVVPVCWHLVIVSSCQIEIVYIYTCRCRGAEWSGEPVSILWLCKMAGPFQVAAQSRDPSYHWGLGECMVQFTYTRPWMDHELK